MQLVKSKMFVINKCCTWCQSKLKCAATESEYSYFQEDINCIV